MSSAGLGERQGCWDVGMLSRLRDVKGLNIPRPGMLRAETNQACVHFGRDVKGYMIVNIPLLSPRSGDWAVRVQTTTEDDT